MCTRDGRYALVVTPGIPALPTPVRSAIRRIPKLDRLYTKQEARRYFSLYEVPGQRHARTEIQARGQEYTAVIDGTSYLLKQWELSPDGRDVVFFAYRDDVKAHEYLFCRPR